MSTISASTEIFRRVIAPSKGTLPKDRAKYVQGLSFSAKDHAKYEKLSAKARAGTLSEREADLLDGYLHVNNLLSILKLKAARSPRV